jgi:hypothetical protein
MPSAAIIIEPASTPLPYDEPKTTATTIATDWVGLLQSGSLSAISDAVNDGIARDDETARLLGLEGVEMLVESDGDAAMREMLADLVGRGD